MNFKGELLIFDLDDTLVKTEAKIRVFCRYKGDLMFSLTPSEFNNFTLDPMSQNLDFSDFECPKILSECTFIYKVFKKMEESYRRGIPVAILTARSSNLMIRNFFLDIGMDIHPNLVIAINDKSNGYIGSISEMKKQAINDIIDMGFSRITFFDDNLENLISAKEVEKTRKVNIKTIHIE